eukprot:gene11426-biopygen5580
MAPIRPPQTHPAHPISLTSPIPHFSSHARHVPGPRCRGASSKSGAARQRGRAAALRGGSGESVLPHCDLLPRTSPSPHTAAAQLLMLYISILHHSLMCSYSFFLDAAGIVSGRSFGADRSAISSIVRRPALARHPAYLSMCSSTSVLRSGSETGRPLPASTGAAAALELRSGGQADVPATATDCSGAWDASHESGASD